MRKRRFGSIFTLVPVMALLIVGTAIAASTTDDGGIDAAADYHGHDHAQHGGDVGHLSATSSNVRLVGKAPISHQTGGRVSDVNVMGNYAYLGAFWEPDCKQGGVYVFDISNPAAPKQVNFINAPSDSYVGEGVQIIKLNTAKFTGDVLVHNNEICDNAGGQTSNAAVGGISLVDVTNPKLTKTLAQGVGDFAPVGAYGAKTAHTVHSAFAWQHGTKAYAVLVDNEEAKDVDIMDITDPRAPTLVAEYDLNADFPQIVDPVKGTSESFSHDMVVKKIGTRQHLQMSYWDGGYVTLDVTNPAAATYVGDTDFSATDPELLESAGLNEVAEGNAHQSEFSKNNDYIVAADEDFDPYSVVALNTTDGTEFDANQGSNTRPIAPGEVISGTTKFVGRACPGDPAVPPASGGATIAVIERGVCDFTDKVALVEQAGGYEAAIIFNRQGSDACEDTLGMTVAGGIPVVGVTPRSVGYNMFNQPGYNEAACLTGSTEQVSPIAVGTIGDAVTLESYFDGWGYVHLYRNGRNKMQELDTYAIPQAHNPTYAFGYGDLSVHEVAMSNRNNALAYLSYYSGGFRVLRIENGELVERGRYIAPGGSNLWGVQLWEHGGKEYVLASDRDYGLNIFEYTGPGRPNP